MSEAVIEADGLCKYYGEVTAVNDLAFQVNKGEIVGLLGPNGAGKSTTMKMLTCYTAPSIGSARVNGHDIFDNPIEVRAGIGYLPENTPLYTEMLVLEYLEFVADMRGLDGARRSKQIRTAVEQAQLGDVIAKEIRTLSKGFKQRVGLAQALVHEPPLLILDEPMSGLDPNQATEVRDVIREIGKERTVILSTHNLAEVQLTCDRVLIIADGKLVADGKPQELSDRAGRGRFMATLQNGAGVAESARIAFESISGSASVKAVDGNGERSQDELTFEILPKADEDLRADIFQATVDAGHTLLGLNQEGQNLEEIFRDLTT